MALVNYSDIFLGVTPKPHRDYLISCFSRLKTRYQTLVVPCCGRFTLLQLAQQAKWPVSSMICSDISLFSTVIGYTLMGKPLDELQISFESWLSDLGLLPDQAADVLVAMKICQLKGRNYYENMLRQYLIDSIFDQRLIVEAHLQSMKTKLEGLCYRPRDLFEEIAAFVDREDVVMVTNVPTIKDGYTKMFDTGDQIKWAEPHIPHFDPTSQFSRLYDLMLPAKAFCFTYRYEQLEDRVKDFATFAGEVNRNKFAYLIANRPDEVHKRVAVRKQTKIKPSKYPQLPVDYQIREDSKLTFIQAPAEECRYYRDLWGHRLGVTRAEAYFYAAVDGYIFAVVGCHLSNAYRGSGAINQTFGFVRPGTRYRLVRLVNLGMTSPDFLKLVRGIYKLEGYEVRGIQTTVITPHASVNANRGIMKLQSREKLKNGLWKLSYFGEFSSDSFSDTLKKWLLKENARESK